MGSGAQIHGAGGKGIARGFLRARRAHGRAQRRRGERPASGAAARSYARACAAQHKHSRNRKNHRGRLRQGRRRKIDHRRQSRARPSRSRSQGRLARRGYLRPLGPAASRDQGETRNGQRQPYLEADRKIRPQGHVDRFPRRGRNADDLARADGDVRDHADAARGGVGQTRHPRRRHAARHGRRAIDARPAGAARGRRDRIDAAGSGADRRAPRGSRCSGGSTCPCSVSSRT